MQKHLVLDSNTNPNNKSTPKGGLVSENIQHATGLSSDEDDGEEPDGQENLTPNLLFTPNDLTKLLKQTDIGKRILQNSNPALSIDSKKELATIIAGHHLTCSWSHVESSKRKLSQFMLENYVSCIKQRFPQETSDAVFYYSPAAPPERRNPGGAIHQAYKRLKTASKERQKREQAHPKKLDESNQKPIGDPGRNGSK
ncbi:hypothetical protein RP20_CCG000691 [Aedes albopictus]|nr:hypothetical protein RP20_CCG000691 [Aedes albopictus]